MHRSLSLFALSLCLALPAGAELPAPDPSFPLEHYGYTFTMTQPEKAVTLTGPAGQIWTLPANPARFDLWLNGPADFSPGDDGLPELIVLERTSRSAGVLHILTLGPEEITVLESYGAHMMEIGAYMDLYPGLTLDDVYGMDPPGILDLPEPEPVEEASD